MTRVTGPGQLPVKTSGLTLLRSNNPFTCSMEFINIINPLLHSRPLRINTLLTASGSSKRHPSPKTPSVG